MARKTKAVRLTGAQLWLLLTSNGEGLQEALLRLYMRTTEPSQAGIDDAHIDYLIEVMTEPESTTKEMKRLKREAELDAARGVIEHYKELDEHTEATRKRREVRAARLQADAGKE